MTTRPFIKHDEKTLRDALRRLVDGVWRGGDRSSRTEVHQSVEPCFSIPANYNRDADLILAVALDELLRLRAHFDSCGDCADCLLESGMSLMPTEDDDPPMPPPPERVRGCH